MSLPCPYCRSKNVRILETRRSNVGEKETSRRRKECLSCGVRHTTREIYEHDSDLGLLDDISDALKSIKKAEYLLSRHGDIQH